MVTATSNITGNERRVNRAILTYSGEISHIRVQFHHRVLFPATYFLSFKLLLTESVEQLSHVWGTSFNDLPMPAPIRADAF